MATDADIPLPVCEVRGEQVGTFVDNIIKITASQLSLEKQTQDEKHDELPTVEGENFLKSPSIVEDHCQANNVPHDVSKVTEEPDQTANEGLDTLLHITKLSDQPVELGAKEETCMEESQQNGEDGNRGAIPEQCSTHSSVITPETDNATGVAQLSKDTSSTNDSSTESIALTKEMLQEHSLLREETQSRISEGEELNVELKTTDDKSADEKPTQEDVLSNLTDKVTAEQEALEDVKSVEDNFNTAAEKVSRENCTSTESIISLETSNGDELPSKSDINSSILEEEETAVQKEDMQIENPAESLHVAPENVEVPDLSQENSIGGLPEEQSRSVTLHTNTIEAQEATTDADDGQKEILESSQPIVPRSHEEGSINEVLQEAKSDHTNEKIIDEDNKGNEVLEDLSSGEAHYKVNNFSPDVSKSAENRDQTIEDGTDTLLLSPKLADQPVEFDANEETSAKEIQQNVAEFDSTDKDVVPEQCSKDSSVVTSETDDVQVDDTNVATQLSNDTSSDHHGSNDSSTKNVSLTKEILQETDLSIKEIKSHAPCISEGEKLIPQVKTTDDKSADQKPTEEDMSCNLTNEVSKGGESDQIKMAAEHEGLENERSVEDNFNTAGEEVSHENSASGETITELETSNNDELKSTSYLNSSISKEEETNIDEGERSVTTSEDHEVPLENTLSESRGVECQSKTLEDAATDYSDPNLGEKSEESPIVPVEDLQIECDEHLEEETERLPVTEVSTGGTNDNVPAATDNVKDEDEVLKDAELSEIEQSTTCTSAKEDVEIENPAEFLHVASENVEVPDLSQENSIEGPSEEKSRNVTPHENTIEAEEATSNADDRQKESLESFPPIVSSSHEEGSLNEVLQEATSDHTNEKITDEDDKHKEVLENLSSGEAHCEVNDTSPDVSKGTENTDQTMKDGTDTLLPGAKPIEFAANEETYVEEIQQNAEESDSTQKVVVPEQCSNDSEIDDREMDDKKVVPQLSKDTSSDQHGSNVSSIESFAITEEIIQETDFLSEETESHAPCISEGEKLNVELKTTDNKSADEKPAKVDMPCDLTNEVSKEGESDQNEITSENEKSVEEKLNTVAEEATHENSTSAETTTAPETSNNDELQSKSGLNSPLSKEEETTVQEGERSVTTSEDYGVPSENTLSESHGDVEYQSKILEDAPTDHNDPKLAEKSKESSIIQIEDSRIECNEHVEEESERLPQIEVSKGGTNDSVPAATDNVKDEDEVHNEAELSESEQSTRCTLVKEDAEIENPAESLPFENIEVSNLSQENNTKVVPEEQSTNATVHGNTIEAEEATIDSTDSQKDDIESIPPIVSGSLEDENMNAVLQEVTSDHTYEKLIDEVDKHEEVVENRSTTASTVDTEGNSLSKLESSENIKGDESVKDCEPLPLDLAREVSDVSPVLHKVQSEDGDLKTAELCDSENILLKTESITENTEAEHVNSQDAKATDLVDKVSEGGTVDVTGEEEEALEVENVPTIVPNEKMEENSHIQVDNQKTENEELLDKENEQVSNNDEEIVKGGSKIEDESPSGTEVFVNDRSAESVLLTEEVESENCVESLPAPHEDVKTSDFGQNTEETGILEEQIPAEKSQGIPSDETEETEIDAANTNEKTQELQNVFNENSDRDFPVEVDAPEMKHNTNLEEEPERQSIEASSEKVELSNDEKSTECTTPKKESLQPEDHTKSTSSADIETPCSLEGQTLAQDSQTIISDKTTDAADEKEAALENVATHEHIEDNSVTQVDCAEREQEEHLENDDQNSSLTEAPEGTDATESKNVDELINRGEDSIKPELENEENTESTCMKEETDVEKPIDSLQIKPEDIKQRDSSSDINNSIEEQISNTDSQKFSIDDAQRESVDATHTNEEIVEIKDITKEIPDCGKEDSIQIEEVGSQNPMNEALAGNDNDDESTKITESCLIKEDEPLDSLQVEAQDIETPPLRQDRETSSPYEKSPIANTEEIMDDNKEEIADSATGVECEFPNDKQNIADTTTLYEETKENLQVQEDCSQLEKNKGIGNDSENAPSTEAPAVPSTEDEKVERPIEKQIPTADPQETCYETEEKIADAASINNDVVVSAPNGDNEDNSLLEVDGLQEPSSEEIPATTEEKNDDEATTAHEAEFANENAVKANSFDDEEKEEFALVKEEVHIESLQVADEDKKDTSSGQDREASLEEQVPTTDSCATIGDQKDAKVLDLTDTKEEALEEKNYATTPSEDTKEDSLLEQKESSEKDSESTLLADSPNGDVTESTLVRERAQAEDSIESSQLETEDVQVLSPCQDSEMSSTVEQILDPEDISSNEITAKITDAEGEENQEDQDTAKSVPREDHSPNEQNTGATLLKEDVSIDLPQVAAAYTKEPCLSEVRETSSQEEQILSASPEVLINDNKENKAIDSTVFQTETPKDEDLTAEKLPCTEDLNVNKDITGHIPEVSNYKQQESSIMEVSKEHILTSNKNASDSASMESEVSEKNNDPVVGEENSCDDKTHSEKIEVLNDGSTAVPTSETLEETDPRGCTETEIQVPNEEKEAKVTEQVAENDQKNIQETQPSYASEDVSESRELNGEEEIDPNSCKEISSSPISEASGETGETREEVETEDQKQESTLQVSELVQDSSVDKIEKDAHLSLASANDSGITEEKQKLEDVPLPAPEEKIIETTDCKEGDVVEGATNNESIDHQEQDDTTRSFSNDKKPTEKEQETVADVIPSASFTEIPREDHSPTETELTNREEPCTEKIATEDDEEKNVKGNEDDKETCEASVEGILVNRSSVTDLETKNDGEALEIKEATPSLAEGQDAEIVNVEETSNCAGSLTEKSDSNEVAITPGENKSGYESNNQGLESIAQVQSCDIISKTEEENHKAEAEIQFDKAVTEDILPEETTCEKEIMKDDISSEKEQLPRINKEDEEITEYSCEDEVITDRHQEDKVNQDQQINRKEIDEYAKNGNETQTVAEVSEETDEKAPEDQEENIATNEATERIIHQEELATSIEEHTTKIDNEKAHELDSACVKSNTHDTNEEGVQIAISPGKETEEQNKKDEICCSDEVQAKDEEKLMLSEGKSEEEAKETCEEACVEAEKLDFTFPTKEIYAISDGAPNTSENKTNSATEVKFSGEDYPNKSTECEVSSASEDIALTEQESEDTTVTAEVQEAKAGIDLGAAVPEATGLESQEVEVLNDKCTEMADTSAPMETKPVHVGGLGSVDVTEVEASPRSLKDKHVVQEAADTRNMNPENLDGDKNISTELSQGEHEIVKPSKVEQECRNEEKTDEKMEGKPESEETEKPSLSDLLRVSNTTRETSQMADHSPTEKEATRHIEDLHAENTEEPEHENSKTDEEKDDEDESHEQGKSDLSSEAPVMVDMGDADVKVTPKKSHNILSGVGSKMKHSIAKVKKAITGKSSQPKTPSPKKATS